MPSRGTPALDLLARSGIEFRIHEYEPRELGLRQPGAGARSVDRHHFGVETAEALGVAPDRLYKTLVAAVDDRLAVGVVPVSAELDLKALAAAVDGRRATMAEPAAAERATGYVVGGISPIGQRRVLPIVLDDGALAQATIYVSGGRRGLQVELAPADLVRLVGARVERIRRL
jgi:Cys-tRNA(Pro)/Cys-tRNA(Cys) deacylase